MRVSWDMFWLYHPSERTTYVRAFASKYVLGASFKPDRRTFAYASAIGLPAQLIFTAALTCPVFAE